MTQRDSVAVTEIIADIQAFGVELQGDPDGIAKILEALRDAIGPRRDESGPKYELYEDSQYGRMIAESEQCGNEAWNWLMDELGGLAKKCRGSMELYI